MKKTEVLSCRISKDKKKALYEKFKMALPGFSPSEIMRAVIDYVLTEEIYKTWH